MKVLEFAFDAGENSDYLPHKSGPTVWCTQALLTMIQRRAGSRHWMNMAQKFVRGVHRGRIHTGGRELTGI